MSETFDRLAAAFYRETGIFAPGVDGTKNDNTYTRDLRWQRWDSWLEKNRERVLREAPHA